VFFCFIKKQQGTPATGVTIKLENIINRQKFGHLIDEKITD
jgi:hypothetical protein